MHHQMIFRLGSCCPVVLALAASVATPTQAMHAPAEAATGTSPVPGISAATRHHHPDVVQPPTRIVLVSRADSFDRTDAAIGASAALGAALLVGGSALLLTRNRRGMVSARSRFNAHGSG
jgi:hypothetical protein